MTIKGIVKGTLLFLSGVGIGYLVADTLKKEQYEQMARDEINEVKAIYKEKLAEGKNSENKSEKEEINDNKETDNKEEIIEYKKMAKVYDYNKIYTSNKSDKSNKTNEEDIEKNKNSISDLNCVTYNRNEYDRPYTINSEDYGEIEEYDTLQLTYFMGDKKLVDEDADDIIEEPDLHVGLDNLKTFEEFPDCTGIYVRNDVIKMDFEILRDDFSYEDIVEKEYPEDANKKPHQL